MWKSVSVQRKYILKDERQTKDHISSRKNWSLTELEVARTTLSATLHFLSVTMIISKNSIEKKKKKILILRNILTFSCFNTKFKQSNLIFFTWKECVGHITSARTRDCLIVFCIFLIRTPCVWPDGETGVSIAFIQATNKKKTKKKKPLEV